MKKLFALLLTVVMMASMMVPAMAEGGEEGNNTVVITKYGEITPNDTTVKHSLRLTEADADRLPYDITYNFTVTGPEVMNEKQNGVFAPTNAVTGSPTISSVTYSEEDFFSPDNKTCEKTLTVDWTPENADPVKIYEPGLYRWTVTQSYSTNAPQAPSNCVTFYLFMYVIDNGGELKYTFIYSMNDKATADKNGTLAETYPAKTLDLTLMKNVSGNQASKDQYFPFTLTLTAPSKVNSNFEYQIVATTLGSYDITVPATAYHAGTTNIDKIALSNGETGTFTLWLKHGQSVTIKNLVYGTHYTITEGGNAGYTVKSTITTTETEGTLTQGGNDTADTKMTADATVAYLNTKDVAAPTGISLQSGVAFFGLVLAMGMMMLMFVGKRKEQN